MLSTTAAGVRSSSPTSAVPPHGNPANGTFQVINKSDNTALQFLKSIAKTSDGVTHLGVDGVVRSFNGDMKVIEYLPLSPEQIQEVIGSVGELTGDSEDLKGIFDSIDGRNVIDLNQLQNPGPELLPKVIEETSEKRRDMAIRRMTSKGDLFERQTTCDKGPCYKDSDCNSFCHRCWKVANFITGGCENF